VRKKLWFSHLAVAFGVVLLVGGPALVIAAGRGTGALTVLVIIAVAVTVLAAWLTGLLAARLARPTEELAEAASRVGAGDPRPLGRRYGVADLDQVAGSSRWTPRISCALR
jgi:hypothetical protein